VSGTPIQSLAVGVKIYITCCVAFVLFTIAVVNVAVLVPEDKIPLVVATTPEGTIAYQENVVGLIDEDTVIKALAPEQIGPTVAGDIATGKGLIIIVEFAVVVPHSLVALTEKGKVPSVG
jgi:hypothetical protein